jgi:outer membrane lipoprotein
MKPYIVLILMSFAILFSGCGTMPKFDTKGVNAQLTPVQASGSPQQAMNQRIIWGGLILSVKNLANATQLEVLAYPLSSRHRPDTSAEPIGRFLLNKQGYLESAEYSEGRYISVQGRISGTKRGLIGETEYLYPVVEAEQLFLWSKDFEAEEPKVHFGIGVIIGR